MTKAKARRTQGEDSIYPDGDGYRGKLTLPDGTVVKRRGRTRADVLEKLDKAWPISRSGYRSARRKRWLPTSSGGLASRTPRSGPAKVT